MKVGIVAEGAADIAVLCNILKGRLKLDRKDVLPIRPELAEDETDLGAPRRSRGFRPLGAERFSNWALVLKECRERTKIRTFLDSQLDEDRFVVVHIDTAEAEETGYDIVRPRDRKAHTYTEELREGVRSKLASLLGSALTAHTRFAIAVEETDAWVLTIHDVGRDTTSFHDPKKRLQYLMNVRKSVRLRNNSRPRGKGNRGNPGLSEHDLYHELTVDFRDGRKLDACAHRNRSLHLFVDCL